jgi:hypothetical protein
MSTSTLIMGESGTGKSTSIRNLDPKETFIINVLDKPLPFKGFKSNYKRLDKDEGNYFASDNCAEILKLINKINISRPDIKNVIIDDFQYVMANEFMRRAREKGFEKFTEIGQNAWNILSLCSKGRDDLFFFILSHTETDALGKSKCKTIGKMLDNTITLEGMFTIVLHSMLIDGKYKLLTQNDGIHVAKSPMGMFKDNLIDNDLLLIKTQMNSYFDTDDKEVFDKELSSMLDQINAVETMEDLKETYMKLQNSYKYDKKLIAELVTAKEQRKIDLEKGVRH